PASARCSPRPPGRGAPSPPSPTSGTGAGSRSLAPTPRPTWSRKRTLAPSSPSKSPARRPATRPSPSHPPRLPRRRPCSRGALERIARGCHVRRQQRGEHLDGSLVEVLRDARDQHFMHEALKRFMTVIHHATALG